MEVVKFIGILLGVVGVLLFVFLVFVIVFCCWLGSKARRVIDEMTEHIAGIGT